MTSNTLRIITAVGTDPQVGTPVVRAMSYRVDGTSLVATEKCPAAGTGATLQFSATGVDGFALYVDPQHRMVYARR